MSVSAESANRAAVAGQSRALALITRLSRLEGVIYSSIGRAIARRPAIPSGAQGFGYHDSSKALLIIFIVLSAFELVIVDLIVHRWPPVRIVLLVIGIWGVVWMIGLLCAHIMRPHTVGPDGIRVRDGMDLDAHVGWDDVYSVEIAKISDEPKSPRVVTVGDATVLAVRISDATNIRITLERPTVVRIPGRPPKGGEHQVTVVRLWADDPKAFLAEVGAHI